MSLFENKFHQMLEWLLTKGRQAENLGDLLTGFSQQSRGIGIPLDRTTIGAPLLHPIAQSSFCAWDLENGLKQSFLVWDERGLSKLKNSPMHSIYTKGAHTDWRLNSEQEAARFSIGPELRDAGFTHYLAFALPFTDGSYKAMTAQTKRKEGFTSEQSEFLKSLIPAISAAAEHHIQRALAETLMNTFVGTRAGTRVLDGQVHLGDGEFIEAVIWMCDLRGFTNFAASREPSELLEALNVYFDTVASAIMREGGEVLKFIGDAVLGIFPVEGDSKHALASAERAADLVTQAREHSSWPKDLDFGIGLHSGEVFYGNVGGRTRLDYTVIGQAVNLVSRIEALCREYQCPLLVTEAIADQSDRKYTLLGQRELKGFKHPTPVYAPADKLVQ